MIRAGVWVLFVLGVAGSAGAQPDEPDALIERGVELRTQGRDEEALALFERAHEIAPSPRALAQIALCEQALARFVPADRHLREALAAGGDAYIERHRQLLESSLRAIDQNLVGVRPSGPAGARVRIGGEDAGTLPLRAPFFVEPGRVTIELDPGGGAEAVRVEADASPAGTVITPVIEAPASRDGGGGDDGGGDAGGGGSGSGEPVDTGGGGGLRILGFVGIGLAAAALVVGIIGHAGRESAASDFNANLDCYTEELAPGECRDLYDSVGSNETLMALGYGGAAVLGIVGAILIAVGGGDDGGPEESAATGCAPTTTGLACRF